MRKFKAYCFKSRKSEDKYCTGFVKGNYYDCTYSTEHKDQIVVFGFFQNKFKETEQIQRLEPVEETKKYIKSI